MVTIGIIGTGALTDSNVQALLGDFVEALGDVEIILPVTKGSWGQAMSHVVQFVLKNDIPFQAIVDETTNMSEEFRGIVREAEKVHNVQRVPNKLLNLLEKSKRPILIAIWDDEDEDTIKAVDRALELEIPAHNMMLGLQELSIEDDVIMPKEQADDIRKKTQKLYKSKEKSVVARQKQKANSEFTDAIIKGVVKKLEGHMQKLLAASETPGNGTHSRNRAIR